MTVDRLAGLTDYDNPLWDGLLDNLSLQEMKTLYADAAYRVSSAKTIGMQLTIDADGGSQMGSSLLSAYGPGAPLFGVSCSTFNVELMERMATLLADTFLKKGAVGVYGPTINLQASAFVGRNSECGSECPILSGKMVAAYCRGFQSEGGYVYMKHFAFYRFSSVEVAGLEGDTWTINYDLFGCQLPPFPGLSKVGSTTLSDAALRNAWLLD